jgi:hypothetical protein
MSVIVVHEQTLGICVILIGAICLWSADRIIDITNKTKKTKLRGFESARELYRPSDAACRCHLVSATDPYGR